uniref:Uncharacterized protein n=1 Tax=Anguilla anguilla TaxID=7936 RepID=A0A0E9TRN6_ANGAN
MTGFWKTPIRVITGTAKTPNSTLYYILFCRHFYPEQSTM